MRGHPGFIGSLVVVLTTLFSSIISIARADMTIQTIGGITYFTHTAALHDCDWIEISPVTRSGTNLTLTVFQRRAEICVACIDCYHTETNTAVLGSLSPGAYQLVVYTPEWGDPFPPRTSVARFEVSASEGPTITTSRTPAGLRLSVAGVTSASYIVESSSTLTNWTGIYTNTGAPFLLDMEQLHLVEQQFYRVRVLPGRTRAPMPRP